MALNISELSLEISSDLNSVNDNCPLSGTDEIRALSTGIIQETQSAIVIYSDPPQYEINGIITNMAGSSMAEIVKNEAGYPNVSDKLLGLCNGITEEILTGICNNGKVTGLSYSNMASLITDYIDKEYTSDEINALSIAITSYIMEKATVSTGTSTGNIV